MATLMRKLRLLQGLLGGEAARVGPYCVTVDVTLRCNLKCLGCRSHSPHVSRPARSDTGPPDLSLDMFARLCDDLRRMGVEYLVLTGEGEPLLHPDIFEILALAKRTGCRVTLFTNGTLLTPAKVEALLDSGLHTLRVSLWAGSQEEYQKNYPGTPSNLFPAVTEGLRRFSVARTMRHRKHPRLVLHEPLNRNNAQGIQTFVGLAAATGCDGVSFSPMRTWEGQLDAFRLSGEAQAELRHSLRSLPPRLQALGLADNIAETRMRYDVGENVWAKAPCYMPWLHARVKVSGAVQVCLPCDRSLGNLNQEAFADIWNGAAYRSLRKSLRRGGADLAARACDCAYCCHLSENLRVHRFFQWVAPLARG